MTIDSAKARSIFLSAVESHAPDQWGAFLDEACQEDTALRKRVELLLQAHQGEDSFLDRGDIDEARLRNSPPHFGEGLGEGFFDATINSPSIAERPGTVIGPYKLLQQIGEGGMGVVFMAEQTEPIRRTVALKIIKPGMDTRQVIARFEAERQALAMMDHPNIARVLDAGTTGETRVGDGERRRGGEPDCQASPSPTLPLSPSSASARPYFVMELVKGVPITDYCDRERLSVRQRLELFTQVCHAVQHAHQKGIIHRDLKPSNVLVAEYDGKPVPKVIDFGVAKATAQRLTERTMFTQYGQIVGTFEYMSPEQARFNQLDVDTRSDIYSLGVLLYELLAGSTPFEKDRLETTPFDETLRIIREEEPPAPSIRLSTSRALTTIAASRQSEPAPLSRLVRGELDWIVMKALEKDRNRRYETAAALAADVTHYLANEPVTAAAPTPLYRLSKFVRRNRVPVVAVLLLAVAIVTGIAASAWQAIRATRAERAALAERDAKQRALGEAVAAKEREAAQRKQAEEISHFLISAFNLRYQGRDIEAVTEVLKHSTEELQNLYADDSSANEALLATIGIAHAGLRRFGEAEKWYRKCLAVAKDPGLVDRIRRELAISLLRQGKSTEAIPMLQEFYFQKRNWAEGANADELLERWSGLPGIEARAHGQSGMDGLELNGLSDYVILPRLYFDGRPPWTLEVIVWPVWIDMSNSTSGSPSGWTSLISAADGGAIGLESVRRRWTIDLYTAGNPGAEWVDNYSSASARSDVALHQWQHVAGIWDGKELRLYVNGQLENTRPGVDYCTQLTISPLFLGADPANLTYGHIAEGFLNGRLRAARISRAVEYTDSFSPPERLEKTPGTIGLYDFTIDTGHYVIDRSGHGNHGIIIGAQYAKAAGD